MEDHEIPAAVDNALRVLAFTIAAAVRAARAVQKWSCCTRGGRVSTRALADALAANLLLYGLWLLAGGR